MTLIITQQSCQCDYTVETPAYNQENRPGFVKVKLIDYNKNSPKILEMHTWVIKKLDKLEIQNRAEGDYEDENVKQLSEVDITTSLESHASFLVSILAGLSEYIELVLVPEFLVKLISDYLNLSYSIFFINTNLL